MSGIVFDICPPSCIIDAQSVGFPDAIAGVPKLNANRPIIMSIRPVKAIMRDADMLSEYHEIVHTGNLPLRW